MINILDFALFRLINDYARLHFLDLIMPIFASELFLIGFVIFILFVFAIICRKIYGNFFWRLMALSLLFVATILVTHFSSHFWKDNFERLRPIFSLPQIVYFDSEQNSWMKTGELVTNIETLFNTPATSDAQKEQSNEVEQAEAQIVEHLAMANKILKYEQKDYNIDKLAEIQKHSGFSMPSSVAACSMAITLIISLLLPRSNPWIYIIPIIIGWARIYTGYSFPLDIVVGWIWGILCVAITWLICDFILRKFSKTRKL